MNEETAIVQQEMVQLGTLSIAPEAIIERATRISKSLAKVIEDRKLYKQIGNNRHVLVEGWNTLGAMVGISPKERSVSKHEDDGIIEYEAYVDLVRNNDGLVIGGASAICRTSENNWDNKPLYAVRSMSVTRATGKAFRLKLSWIMELAGFSPTPAEEMDFINGEARDVTPKKTGQGSLTKAQIKKYKSQAKKDPVSIQSTQFWTVAKHFGIDSEQGQAIYKEIGNWADALIHVVDRFGEINEEA